MVESQSSCNEVMPCERIVLLHQTYWSLCLPPPTTTPTVVAIPSPSRLVAVVAADVLSIKDLHKVQLMAHLHVSPEVSESICSGKIVVCRCRISKGVCGGGSIFILVSWLLKTVCTKTGFVLFGLPVLSVFMVCYVEYKAKLVCTCNSVTLFSRPYLCSAWLDAIVIPFLMQNISCEEEHLWSVNGVNQAAKFAGCWPCSIVLGW